MNHPERPCIVISASGMASGGRVVHHLAAFASDRRNSVVLIGFQAPGNRGYDLAHGVRQIKALGRYRAVQCAVEVFEGMSVHADAEELVAWLGSCPDGSRPETCYVVHGEPAAASALANRLREGLEWLAVVRREGEVVRID